MRTFDTAVRSHFASDEAGTRAAFASGMNRSLRAFLAASFLASTALVGCSSAIPLAADPTVPFTQGEVDASFEDGGNGTITVHVHHLGDPAKIAPGATSYVVWILPKKDGAEPQNVGALKVDSDQEGELTFTTPFRSFTLTVTPEAATDAQKPTGRDLLKGLISG